MSGLREQKKARARDALATAALELFNEQGFEKTTVDAIAERAGVSRRSFFRYFPTKESSAFPEQEARLQQFGELLRMNNAATEGFAAVREACFAIARAYMSEKNERYIRFKLTESSPALALFEMSADRQLEAIIVTALATGDDHSRRRAEVIAAATIGTIRVTMREWFDGKCKLDLLELGREAFTHLENGFMAYDRAARTASN
jgi:AcrR family transcriptional regulator